MKIFCMVPYCWIHVTIYLSKPTECTRLSSNLNFWLGVIMMCQCRFMNYNHQTTTPWAPKPPFNNISTGGDVATDESCACVGIRNLWECYLSPSEFRCEPKMSLKCVFKKTTPSSSISFCLYLNLPFPFRNDVYLKRK